MYTIMDQSVIINQIFTLGVESERTCLVFEGSL